MIPDLADGAMSTAELVLFWVVAPIAVIAAGALIVAKRAVTAAICMVVTMVCLAVLYVALDAPFLAMAQVVVYTGAIMMLFIFVLMLVGVDVADSFTETIRGQRLASVIFALGLAAVLIGAVARATLPDPAGIPTPASGGNPAAVAAVIFGDYPFTLELVGTLLITAALGAVVMTHRARLAPRRGQREMSIARVKAGTQVTPHPAPGVYAGRNAVDVPALDAAGQVIATSVPESLRARGQSRQIDAVAQPAFDAVSSPPEPSPPPEREAPPERETPAEPESEGLAAREGDTE
ncbi:MAG: NADH-quinone oxidoreductase subunit J [Bifidobacteriaceae bacterium]|nr:NADH-quinone oxidoreductase subunit J [Bifidobacteriaceae bacterium]